MTTNLMGVDVGFSKTRRTTGIACLEGDHLTLERVGTSWESRKSKIPDGFRASIIAIDGPRPLGAELQLRRHVEPLFICAPFHITVGDPALVVIMASDWSCERHSFRLPATNGILVPLRSHALAPALVNRALLGSCARGGW